MRKVAYALGTFLLLVAVCFAANLVLAISGKEHKGGGPSTGANYALSAAYAAIALKTGTQCDSKNIVYAGRSMKGRFKGDWADYIKSANVDGAGITATVSNPVGNWSNSTTDVYFSALPGTAAGERTVTASFKPNFGGITSRTFKLTVIPMPYLTGATITSASPKDCFQQAVIALTGGNLLGNSGEGPRGPTKAFATVMVDASNPLQVCPGSFLHLSDGSNVSVSDLGIESSTYAQVRLGFSDYLKKASVEITLTGDGSNPCSTFGSGPGTQPPPKVTRIVAIAAR
jgi:hypothetical protein